MLRVHMRPPKRGRLRALQGLLTRPGRTLAQYPNIDSIGSIGSNVLAILHRVLTFWTQPEVFTSSRPLSRPPGRRRWQCAPGG